MRKSLLTIAAVLCCWVTMMAEPVTPEAARQAAVKFLNRKGTALKSEAMRKTQRTQPSQSMNAYYVFNATGSQGFVVVAGDDCVGDNLVLGYCDSGSFDAEAIPANMQAWLDDVAGQITLLAGSGAKAQRVAVHEDIAPLVTCHWDQSFPYNALCPMKEGGQSVTGCVATALAQVIYYHRWPQEPIVAAAAQTRNPVRQALVSSTGTFWDTVVICALTGLVLVSSIIAYPDITFDDGAALTKVAFSKIPYIGAPLLAFGILTFAFSTILGWSYYGESAVSYLDAKK